MFGNGGLKRLAARASLQASSKDPILTADVLYQWAKKNLVETLVFFSPKENHAITAQELKSRFASANTVPGTQEYPVLLMFLVGFRLQKKCNSRFHVFKRFDSDLSPHQ